MNRQRNKTFLIGSGIFLLMFLSVVFFISGPGQQLDQRMAMWAEEQHAGFFEALMKYASFLGSSELVLLMTIIIGLVLLILRKWRHFFFFFVLSVGGVFLNLILKLLVHRARPGEEVEYIDVFSYQLEIQSYSFPSGHTMRAAIFFLFLIYLVYSFGKRTGVKWLLYILFTMLILAVPLSRIMLDAHFATDVLGGVFMSGTWFFFCLYFFHKSKKSYLSF